MIIETIAPIGLEDLKKYFVDKSISFLIDYENSKIQGNKLLTYISNLDIPIDIKFDPNNETGESLLEDYMNTTFLVNIPSLEIATINKLLEYRFEPVKSKFIEKNQELLDHWATLLDSSTLFNFYCLQNAPEMKEWVESFPKYSLDVVTGINFVQLFKYKDFYQFYQKNDESKLKYCPEVFNDYIFKGNNLFHYWSNENNIMFMLTWGIIQGHVTAQNFAGMVENTKMEIENATSI